MKLINSLKWGIPLVVLSATLIHGILLLSSSPAIAFIIIIGSMAALFLLSESHLASLHDKKKIK